MSSRDVSWMWDEALSLLEQAERLQRQFFRPVSGAERVRAAAAGGESVPCWEPPVDVVESADALFVHVALPGVSADTIVVGLESGALTVSALRAFPASARGARLHRVEIPYGRFFRRIALPMQALEPAGRALADGCLTLAFRKRSVDDYGEAT